MSGADDVHRTQETASPLRRLRGALHRRLGKTGVLYLYVSIGSVLGSVLRALASLGALAVLGPGFPWGTLFVNVAGSFLIGFYATLSGPDGRLFASTAQRQFVLTGFCGGFTTFSVFSLDALTPLQQGRLGLAAVYIAISIITWLGAVWLGHGYAARINRLGGR